MHNIHKSLLSTQPLWAYYTLPSCAGVNMYNNKDNMTKVYKSTLYICIYIVTYVLALQAVKLVAIVQLSPDRI